MDDVKLPKRVISVIEKVRAGQTLVKTYRHKESGDTEVVFSLHPSGKMVGPASAEQATTCGLLAPNNDGLFGAESSQTWRAA